MIDFDDVRVRYPRAGHDVLAGVSFAAEAGRVTALVGPNGSGKSTLVRALLGRVMPAQGAVRIGAVDRRAMPARTFARAVAVVTQREETIFPRPVVEYLSLGRFPHRGAAGRDRGATARAVAEAAERAGVGELLGRRTDELSGGEWQRVRIARALVQGAPMLVLDEPTAFLDIAHEMAVFELLATLARGGCGVLLVSHQLNLVARFAAHVVLLAGGHVAATGPPDTVMRGDVLERVYDWPLVVTRDPAVGAPALVPLRARH